MRALKIALVLMFVAGTSRADMMEKCGTKMLECRIANYFECNRAAAELSLICIYAMQDLAMQLCLADYWIDGRMEAGYDEVVICQKDGNGMPIPGSCWYDKIPKWGCVSLWRNGVGSESQTYQYSRQNTLEMAGRVAGKLKGLVDLELNAKGGIQGTTANGGTFQWEGDRGLNRFCIMAYQVDLAMCLEKNCENVCKL